MALFLFAFISWICISVFFLIPKGLSVLENVIAFFCITIIIINISTITDLNLQLVENSSKPDLFICYWTHRNIIMPLCLLVFANLIISLKTKLGKFIAGAAILLILHLVELLTVWFGIKTYNGWNSLLDLLGLGTLMALSAILAWALKKL